ncbi:MAG TPA: hypothetical protein VEX39_16390 [Thermoleophilaceae bacterium]|nr:hypothetical protein [Thermoleophilaceae bacterium]
MLALGVATGCGGDSEPDPSDQIEDVARDASRSLDRFADALRDARVSDKASLVRLRASAGRVEDDLRDARSDLGDIEDESEGSDRRKARDLEDALADIEELAGDVQASPPSRSDIEVAAERAEQSVSDSAIALPRIDADRLLASMEKRRAKTTPGGVSAPIGQGSSTTQSSRPVAYRDYTGPAFQAKVPTGAGWAAPSQSEPTPGQLFRTNVRGPNGLFVAIDFTPLETAKFGGRYSTRTEVGQTAFGSATRYEFQGGRLPECQSSPCIDYIINGNGASGGSGFAVVAGGGAGAAEIAQTVANSVTPIGDYAE